jgi:SNF2 family DNA or RNA helicase
MLIIPREHQRIGASQGVYYLEGPLRLFLLGDEIGVGKTLQGVMMMATNRHQPGINLVVCPKGVYATWVETIHCAFKEVRALIPWITTASRDVDIRMDK